MGNTDGGTFRRMLRKLTSDVEELDAEHLSGDAERSGAQRADECRRLDVAPPAWRARAA